MYQSKLRYSPAGKNEVVAVETKQDPHEPRPASRPPTAMTQPEDRSMSPPGESASRPPTAMSQAEDRPMSPPGETV